MRDIHSLFQFRESYSFGKDAISLYVENGGDGNVILHRQFYNHSDFSSFLLNDYSDLPSLNLSETIDSIPLEDFLRICKNLAPSKAKNNFDYIIRERINDAVMDFSNEHNSNYRSNNLDDFLMSLNDIFCSFYYSINQRQCIDDSRISEKVDSLIEKIEYREEFREDFVEDFEIEDINDSDEFELRVYNVGQANCSALIKYIDESKKDYRVVMVFDFGFQKSMGKNLSLNEMISKIDCDTRILISHYDSDHINNITNHLYLCTSKWIFPNYSGKGVKALKVFQTLLKVATKKTRSGNVYSFRAPFNISSNISIHQYTGNVKLDKNQSTLMNSQSLVAKIATNKANILIPADALYEEFGDELTPRENEIYTHILIPHHCCKYDNIPTPTSNAKINQFINIDTTGIVLSGRNPYGHANVDHLLRYTKKLLFNKTAFYKDKKTKLSMTLSSVSADYIKIDL